MMRKGQLVFIYELNQLSEVLGYLEAHPSAQILCLDFWVERELMKKNIPCISLRDFMPEEDAEEEWWLLAQDIAREWYRLPAMKFFEHDGIRIGEALEPMMEAYLSRMLYYVRIFAALKQTYPGARFHVPSPFVGDISSAGPLALFERRAVADAARMAGLERTLFSERILPNKDLFPRAVWKSLLIHAYNTIIGLMPRRGLKIYASEYWSHIAPVITQMDDAELVLMESSELKKIPLRQILKHRIRVRHPAEAAHGLIQRDATRRLTEFMGQWETVKKDVAQYLSAARAELDWNPVLEACEYLVTYSPRVIADTDALRLIMEEEKPDVVLQRASIGGRQHHFFLMARVAAQLKISSIELQHAGAMFDPHSVHSRLETTYLAAYGEVEREQYVRNGYAPERIVAIGSPRLDRYSRNISSFLKEREKTLRVIGLDVARRVVMIAVPLEQAGLYALNFSSYDIAAFFQEVRNVRRTMPEVQFLFKFRQRNCGRHHRTYLSELFPEGDIAIAEGDSCPLIGASDCVVSGNSTIMYEAMISGRPLILYPWKKWDYHLGMYSAVAPYVQSGAELADILKRIFSDKPYAREMVEKEHLFTKQHAFDGRSVERMIAFLHKR